MPRPMPPLGTEFGTYVDRMLAVCSAIEVIRETSPSRSSIRRELTHERLVYLYEASYLRVFARWENFLEETCARYMLGYASPLYQPVHVGGRQSTLADARKLLYRNRDFALWHNPTTVSARAADHLVGSPIETVTISSLQSLTWMAAVRHRVAHDSSDARSQFDAASMGLAGRRFPGSRPGRLLRSSDGVPHRWLSVLATRLKNTALQIAP